MFAIGIDLRLEKQKSKKDNEPFISFKDMINEYLEYYRSYRNEKYWQGVDGLFRRDVLPVIGDLPIERPLQNSKLKLR